MPSSRAAPCERSITFRESPHGPRSLMRTRTRRPVSGRRTSTQVPNGRRRCAAVMAFGSKRSPSAVFLQANARPYHVARPTSSGLPGSILCEVEGGACVVGGVPSWTSARGAAGCISSDAHPAKTAATRISIFSTVSSLPLPRFVTSDSRAVPRESIEHVSTHRLSEGVRHMTERPRVRVCSSPSKAGLTRWSHLV